MNLIGRCRRAHRQWLWLLPALALRLCIPAGFMPGAGPTGPMQICHGDTRAATLLESGIVAPGSGEPDSREDHSCVFAAAGHATLLPSPPAPAFAFLPAPPAPAAVVAGIAHNSLAHRPQSARAPPGSLQPDLS
jgi:hypothetical protein